MSNVFASAVPPDSCIRPSRILCLAFNGLFENAAGHENVLAHRLKPAGILPATNAGKKDLCSGLDDALDAAYSSN